MNDIDNHEHPINDMIHRIDTFYNQNIDRLSPEQKEALQRLSNDLRNRYDELLRKYRQELTDSENRLNQLRNEQEESVCTESEIK